MLTVVGRKLPLDKKSGLTASNRVDSGDGIVAVLVVVAVDVMVAAVVVLAVVVANCVDNGLKDIALIVKLPNSKNYMD